MGLLDKLGAAAAAFRKGQQPKATGIGADPFTIWAQENRVSPAKAMSVYNNWVYACIRAIAEEVGKMEFVLKRVKANGDEEILDDHELLQALRAVNPFQTGFELQYLTAAYLEQVGNAYWLLDGVTSRDSKPSAIYLLDPSKVKINRLAPPEFVGGYTYKEGNVTKTYEPYEILHIRYPNPKDIYEGIGTVQAIADWIDADSYATEFNRNFFRYGAHIGGFLESDAAYTPEQLDYLRKSFEEIYKGVDNAYKTAALPKGTKFTAAQSTQKEMDFVEGMRLMRDKILAGFRVPAVVLGIGAGENMNRATAEASHYVFMARNIKPKMDLITTYLNEFLVPRYGKDLYLDVVDPVPQNRELLLEEMKAALAGQPAMSVNEARQEYYGLAPVNNGDAVMTNFSLVPLGKPEKAAKPAAVKSKGGKRPTSRGAAIAAKRSGIGAEIAEKIAAAVEQRDAKVKEIKVSKKDITQLTHEEYDPIHKSFVSRVEPYVRVVADKVRDYNDHLKKQALANLPNAAKSFNLKTKADLLDDYDANTGVFVKLVKPPLTEVFSKEGAEAAALLGMEINVLDSDAVQAALDKTFKLFAEHYTETTAQLLKDQLAAGLEDGDTLPELKDRINNVFEFSDNSRAEMVARTETFRTANEGTREAWKQSKVVKTIKWYTADSDACPLCEAMDGKIVDVEENFLDKGDTLEGTDGSTLDISYSDVGGGALHPNCRCFTRPDTISVSD